jgi:hypothetical protein
MSPMMQKARTRLRRVLGGGPAARPGPAPTAPGRTRPSGPPPGKVALKEVRALRERVLQLEADVQESRHLNKRLAELVDVVAEVLLPAEQRDEERLTRLLEDYDRGL